jgi:hypothetical protein
MKNHIHYDANLTAKRWVGYFDLLGVKQIYKTKDHIQIFIAISSAAERCKERSDAWGNVGYAWFSDTFIFFTNDDSAESLKAIENISRWFVYSLITNCIPVRGAISCDAFYADRENDIFFGEALLEAYKYGEAQDWIGFILSPSAEKRLKQLETLSELRLNYVHTDIPFKTTSKLNHNLSACIIGKNVGKTTMSGNNKNPIIEKLSQMKKQIKDENGLHPPSWTKYVRVVGRNQSPGKREKGSCHEAPKEFCC